MIRFFRTVLLAAMATVLLIVAFANLETVTLRFLPTAIGTALGMDRVFQVPLFLVILLAMLSGIALGFVWEWRREAKHRSAASQHRKEAARLEREVSRLRKSTDADQDDVLALLEAADRPR